MYYMYRVFHMDSYKSKWVLWLCYWCQTLSLLIYAGNMRTFLFMEHFFFQIFQRVPLWFGRFFIFYLRARHAGLVPTLVNFEDIFLFLEKNFNFEDIFLFSRKFFPLWRYFPPKISQFFCKQTADVKFDYVIKINVNKQLKLNLTMSMISNVKLI